MCLLMNVRFEILMPNILIKKNEKKRKKESRLLLTRDVTIPKLLGWGFGFWVSEFGFWVSLGFGVLGFGFGIWVLVLLLNYEIGH